MEARHGKSVLTTTVDNKIREAVDSRKASCDAGRYFAQPVRSGKSLLMKPDFSIQKGILKQKPPMLSFYMDLLYLSNKTCFEKAGLFVKKQKQKQQQQQQQRNKINNNKQVR